MAEEGTNQKQPVCVTGANGFIGTWLVRTLLDRGYATIHASVFPGSDVSHLLGLPGAAGRVVVHEADLLDAAAVSMAVEPCEGGGVFHVASPCTLEDPEDPQKELVMPAVQGTLNVLAAAKMFGVKRVVVTSSISALVPNPNWPRDKAFDESSWTDLDYCKSRRRWYPVSKTLAEKATWQFKEKHGLDVVAIHPATCLGPLLQPGLNASCAVLQQLLQGSKDTQEYHWLGAVHVKDVAEAQVLLFETPAASGRYLCTNGIYQFGDFAERVSQQFPEFPVYRFEGETQPGLVAVKDAAKRLIDLGLVFTPIEDAVKDTVESLKEKGFLRQEQSQS
ncbi:phenylacetaldehyde reductase isoform X2 [Diospyros lotus]|uniref:phenylacetaldehyde reductase isoform X2 n=1 Tax=Diospyros lotus TaxID=55363 RepID=UPI002251AF6D|nr:phenylacetaldehyde reductase isoform X2 [Diospyros lotus]